MEPPSPGQLSVAGAWDWVLGLDSPRSQVGMGQASLGVFSPSRRFTPHKSRACPEEGSLPGDGGGGEAGLHPGEARRLWTGTLGFSLVPVLITCLTLGVLLDPTVPFFSYL